MSHSASQPSNRLSRITSLGQSFQSGSPIAEASIARDLEDCTDDEEAIGEEGDDGSDDFTVRPSDSAMDQNAFSFVGSYRRPSFAAAGARATVIPHYGKERDQLTKAEREAALAEERSLLRDNNLIPPKHPQAKDMRRRSLGFLRIPGGDATVSTDEEATVDGISSQPTETEPLLGDPNLPYGGQDDPENISKKWDEAVQAGMISTTWQREAKVIARYSGPLMITFILQYSLTVASIFTVGHLSSVALGAVSIASMTANIFGYAIYQGLATALDTLCAQAYGSGRKQLVGLQFQRMVLFLWLLTIPIAIIWLLSDKILNAVLPEPEVAALAGLYLKVVVAGAPGYALFECGKRYVQAQGIFSASLYVLIVVAPFNAFMNWLFVWKLQMGFVGAPIAVAISDNLLWIGLFLYVYFVNGRQCWNGFTHRVFQNWLPMVKLALPGFLMVEAECLAFEILTFGASYFGVTVLAAQSVISTLASITFQIPFPLSIATSTRVANLIGATLAPAARTSAKVGLVCAAIVGCLNVLILSSLKDYIPHLFTSDEAVIAIVSDILPICAAFQLFDALAANCNGILRGLGRQEVGGWVQLFCYYVIAMPISFGTAFGLHWGLRGLWTGVALALGFVCAIEAVFLYKMSWERSVEEARKRNENE